MTYEELEKSHLILEWRIKRFEAKIVAKNEKIKELEERLNEALTDTWTIIMNEVHPDEAE